MVAKGFPGTARSLAQADSCRTAAAQSPPTRPGASREPDESPPGGDQPAKSEPGGARLDDRRRVVEGDVAANRDGDAPAAFVEYPPWRARPGEAHTVGPQQVARVAWHTDLPEITGA